MEGHFRNPIVTFEARLTKPREVEDFTTFFRGQLSKADRLLLERDLDLYSDAEGNLYIRIDKQRSFRGKVQLGGNDPIRVRMKFSRFTPDFTELMIKYLESD
jgi:RNA binding exosome subunit